MRLSTVVSVVLAVLLVGSGPGAIAAVPSVATAGPSGNASQDRTAQTAATNGSALETADPAQVIRINVTESGDAVWTIESRFRLSDRSETDAFLEYGEEIADGEREGVYDRSMFDPHVEAAADATDREMAIRGAGWNEPRLRSPDGSEPTVGVLSYSFTWTEFAAVNGTRIHVGDAFQGADGPWLSALVADQRLVIQSPSNHGFHDYNLPVSPQDSALVVDGPYQFSEDELEVTFLRGAGEGATGGTGGSLPASAELLLGGLVVLAVGIAAASYALARRSSDPDWSPAARIVDTVASERRDRADDSPQRSGSSGSSDRRDSNRPAAPETRAPDTTRREATTESAGQTFAYVEESDERTETIDPELLSDEERVLRLLRRNGGRMKQGSIVSETGWSNAKVSQLLSQMAEDGEIDKLRIGRENLITLPEVDPTELD